MFNPWGEKKEPYITIEVASEEDYKILKERLESEAEEE